MKKLFIPVVLALLALAGCATTPAADDGSDSMPSWIETVFPEPGAVVTAADAVEVDHNLTATDNDIRLLIDGVDVTTYAAFDAAKLRYESGVGPVELDDGDHTAEVQRVVLSDDESQFEVIDSFSWEFRLG